jgi:hypothetical protein
MQDSITFETELFNYTEVKPHFINPGCFGEDAAAWLKQQVSPIADFTFSDLIQEDYGWGFWASHGKDAFWIAVGCVRDEQRTGTPEWNVSVNYDPGLNLAKRLFHRPDEGAFTALRDRIWQALRSSSAIRLPRSERE